MSDVNNTASDTPTSRELSRDVQALINNGLGFLDKAREELGASKSKFSIVSFWTAVEILLKVPLAHEHWSLVYSPEKPIRKQTYLAGDPQSMTYEEAREKLKDVLEGPLDRETDSTSGKVREYCNHVVHFYHPTFTEAEQRQIPKEQTDAWFALNRLLRDEWKVIFGVKHNRKLAFGETRLIRGNKFYAEVRFKQVKPGLEQLSEKDIRVGSYGEYHQHATVIGAEMTGSENRKFEVTRCKVRTGAVRQVILVYPGYEIPQLLPEGDSDLECEHCDYTSGRYKLLDEELFHSVDEQLLSVFPAGCTNYMTPGSVCKSEDGYLYTQCFIYHTKLHACGCYDHLDGSIPELNRIRGREFRNGGQRYFDD